MSDIVAKADIEDVLSSIRRLLNEEGRKKQSTAVGGGVNRPDRLVLTQALRVGENGATTVPEIESVPDANGHEDGAGQARAKRAMPWKLPESRLFELAGKAVTEAGNDAAADDDPLVLKPTDTTPVPEQTTDTAASEPVAFPATDVSEVWEPEFHFGRVKEQLTQTLSSKIESLETAIAQTDDQWEPDGTSDDAYSGTRTSKMDWDPETHEREKGRKQIEPDASPTSSLRPAKSEQAPKSPMSETGIDDKPVQFVHRRPQPLKSLVGQTDASAAPNGANGKAIPVSAAETSKSKAARPGPGSALEQLAAADDDTLRVLVADIVRQELQGPLGERITRNVRKLVRSEIHRALAAYKLH